MRASTLFALTVAVLLGLATAVTLKVTGFFNGPQAPPPVAAVKAPEINVLVSGRSLFKGNLIDAPWVGVRALRPEEVKDYEQHKDEYLPPAPAAITFRVAAKNIEADRPLVRSDLEDLQKPPRLSDRLLPTMRAVNVSAMKDESAGGLIQVGEWVDVLLTTQIQKDDGNSVSKTAGIAHRLRVIAKRNALWEVIQVLPDGKPVDFTLEANPYRAALIEYCKTKGTLSLVPVSANDQKNLEAVRQAAVAQVEKGIVPVSYKAPFPENSLEYQDEEARIEGVLKGEVNVGTSDLIRIYSLRTSAPPPANTEIMRINGVTPVDPAVFDTHDKLISTPKGQPVQPAATHAVLQDWQFAPLDNLMKKCKNCGKKNPQ